MTAPRLRQTTRVAALVLALVAAVVQSASARAAVCGAATEAHVACKCCQERAAAPQPVIAGDCCAVEETAVTSSPAPVPVTAPPSLTLVPPALVAVVAVAPRTPWECPAAADVEVRAAGPPLWLRTRSLRL
jgi:hypothetical protein